MSERETRREGWATRLVRLLPLFLFAVVGVAQDHQPQPSVSITDIPVFRSESRQVLIGGSVQNATWNSDVDFRTYDYHTIRGLRSKDFRIFDDGKEQSINFFAERDFERADRPWLFGATPRGTWVTYSGDRVIPTAFYLLGYVPPALSSGECHTVNIMVHGGYMILKRHPQRYCNLKIPTLSEDLQEGTKLGTQMREFAASAKTGPISVALQTFGFRSSGVLKLETTSSNEAAQEESRSLGFKYVVEVHDSKAPANIQIAIAFGSPKIRRDYRKDPFDSPKIKGDYRKDGWYLSLYVLGMVYDAKGQLVQQFGDSYDEAPVPLGPSCDCEHWEVPSLYETQVELSPGDYELRVVVSDGRGNVGQAQIPVKVERFGADRLSMSDVVLTDMFQEASGMLGNIPLSYPATLVPTPLVSDDVQFFPSMATHFKKGMPLSAYFELYEPLLEKQAVAVSFELRVTNLKTGELKVNTGMLSAAKWVQPGNSVVPIAVGLASKELSKGPYKLELRASDSAGRQTQWHPVDFTIE